MLSLPPMGENKSCRPYRINRLVVVAVHGADAVAAGGLVKPSAAVLLIGGDGVVGRIGTPVDFGRNPLMSSNSDKSSMGPPLQW
jgi:hypothetical protein